MFDVLLQNAMRLCGRSLRHFWLFWTASRRRTVAAQGLPPALGEWRQTNPIINSRNTLLKRVVAGDLLHSYSRPEKTMTFTNVASRCGDPLLT